MASNETSLPPWASKVFFSTEEDDNSTQVLVEKLEEVRSRWYELGLELRLPPKELDDIKSNQDRGVPAQKKFLAMLSYWIDHGKASTRTWGFLATAVEKSDNRALAVRIRKRGDYKEGEEVTLELVDLSSLLYELQPHWKKLSDKLRIPITEKNKIDDQLSVETCLTDMLHKWIITGLATIEALIRALESHSVENRRLADNIAKDVEVFELLRVSSDDPAEKKSIERQLENYIKKLQGRETIDTDDGDSEAASTTTTAKSNGAAYTTVTAKTKGVDTADGHSEVASTTMTEEANEATTKVSNEINFQEWNWEELLGRATPKERINFLKSIWILFGSSTLLLRKVVEEEARIFQRKVPGNLHQLDLSLLIDYEARLKSTRQHEAFPGLFFDLASSHASLSDTTVEKSPPYRGKEWTKLTVEEEFRQPPSNYNVAFVNRQKSKFKPSKKANVLYLKRKLGRTEKKENVEVYFGTEKYDAVDHLIGLRNKVAHPKDVSMSDADFDDLVNDVEKCYKALTDDKESIQVLQMIKKDSLQEDDVLQWLKPFQPVMVLKWQNAPIAATNINVKEGGVVNVYQFPSADSASHGLQLHEQSYKPGSSTGSQRTLSNLVFISSLSIDDSRRVMDELRNFKKGNWKELGQELGLSETVLDEVEADYNQKGVRACLVEMLKHWLRKNYRQRDVKPPTWSNLADAVEKAGDPALAEDIRKLS